MHEDDRLRLEEGAAIAAVLSQVSRHFRTWVAIILSKARQEELNAAGVSDSQF